MAADAKTKVYGTADPELTYQVTGLKAGDSLTGSLTRDAGESVGSHAGDWAITLTLIDRSCPADVTLSWDGTNQSFSGGTFMQPGW